MGRSKMISDVAAETKPAFVRCPERAELGNVNQVVNSARIGRVVYIPDQRPNDTPVAVNDNEKLTILDRDYVAESLLSQIDCIEPCSSVSTVLIAVLLLCFAAFAPLALLAL